MSISIPTPLLLFPRLSPTICPHSTPNHLSAEGEGNILARRAHLDLAARRRHTRGPDDGRASRLRTRDHNLLAGERIPKDVAQVVPDVVAVQAVGEDGLGRARVEAVGGDRHLERLAARHGVLDEGLRVGAVLGNLEGALDRRADGPDVHVTGALVGDFGEADGGGQGGRRPRGRGGWPWRA